MTRLPFVRLGVLAGVVLALAPSCGREPPAPPVAQGAGSTAATGRAEPTGTRPTQNPQLRAAPGLAPVAPPGRRTLLVPSALEVGRLAAALALPAPARPADGAWTATDGRRLLRVAATPGGRWQLGPAAGGCPPCRGPAPCAPCPGGAGSSGTSTSVAGGAGPLAGGAEALARRVAAATGFEVRAVRGSSRGARSSVDVALALGEVAVSRTAVHVEVGDDGSVASASGPLAGLGAAGPAAAGVEADAMIASASRGAWSSCTAPAGAVCPPASAVVVAMTPAWTFEADHLAPAVELRLDDGSLLVVPSPEPAGPRP